MTQKTSITLNITTPAFKNKIISAYSKYEKPVTTQYVEKLFILPNCRITLYTSGKLLFQGNDAANEAMRWDTVAPTATKTVQDRAEAPKPVTFAQYIGCDETGVGDYFGPLVACAVYVDQEIITKITHLNIIDSKQLTDAYIATIAPELRKLVPYAVTHLSNAQYNRFIANGLNGNIAKVFVHQQAITKLFQTTNLVDQTPIIMDAFSTKELYYRYLDKLAMPNISTHTPTHFEQKAENKYLGVAVASIIGRAHFLECMQTLNDTYATQFPLGAGKHVDTFGQNFVRQHSADTLKEVGKWHFSNTERMLR